MGSVGYGAMWCGLVALRLAWTLLPQHGYIHPDEFFQTAEIVSGDVLSIEVNRPWEFNRDWPIRSIALPYSILGPPLYALRILREAGFFPGALSPPSYWVLVTPRLVVALLSICVDILIGKVAKNLKINPQYSVLMFATSYMTVVHLTRTFTNTLETFICAVLLYYCTKKRKMSRNRQSLDNVLLSLTVVAGFFNRPTFLAFALVPLLSWCYTSRLTARKIFECVIFGLIFVAFFVLVDTVYFRGITPHALYDEVLSGKFSFNSTRITPYAWALYNSHPSNLADHGLHPRYTHLLINIPMLFGPSAFVLYGSVILMLKSKCDYSWRMLVAAVLCPVAILSSAPHQEPRFLLPVLPAVALICGPLVFAKRFPWRILRVAWIIFNILGAFVFGVLHQGGVTRSLSLIQSRINQEIDDTGQLTPKHVIFYHTYMPPQHLLAKPVQSTTPKFTDNLHIHDLMGSELSEVELFVSRSRENSSTTSIVLVTPAPILTRLCQKASFKFRELETVWPHVSFEDLPSWESLFSQSWYLDENCAQTRGSFGERVYESLSLKILQLE